MQPQRPTIEEIERLLRSTAPKIQSHSAIITLGGDESFSGVWVKCFGYEGILTAGHCATQFLAEDNFVLVVSEAAHKFIVEPKDFEHIRIGEYDEFEGYSNSGPDLSFVIIRNENVLRALHIPSVEFYDITQKKMQGLDEGNLDSINWAVVGSPREKVEIKNQIIDGRNEMVTVASSIIVQGTFDEYKMDDDGGFDYLRLDVGSSFEDFPVSYNGVSGGGIWYQKFVKTGPSYVAEPHLVGIACWESKLPIIKRGYKIRKVSGHGFLSIYGRLWRVLYDKALKEQQAG